MNPITGPARHNTGASTPPSWHVAESVPGSCYEWTGFTAPAGALGRDAQPTGGISLDAGGKLLSLHHAPARWLVVEPSHATVAALLSQAQAGSGALVEVTGKWRRFVIGGAAAPASGRHPLEATCAIEAVLRDRSCAALYVFDCPAIIARRGSDLEIFVESSYGSSVLDILRSLGVD